jgi:hypothetical protein
MRTTTPVKALIGVHALAGLVACGPKLSSEGVRVHVAETAQAPLCRPIGNVEGEGNDHEKAEIQLRNKAGELKANTVVITEHAMTPGEVKLVGQAYGCSASNAPAAAPVVVPAPVSPTAPATPAPAVPAPAVPSK